jgi:hypothetical protein
MQHLLDHTRSSPNHVAAWFHEVDAGTVLAHSAHADQLLPL